jgi:hypothetical protein
MGMAGRGRGQGRHLDRSVQIHHHNSIAEIAHKAKVITDEQSG